MNMKYLRKFMAYYQRYDDLSLNVTNPNASSNYHSSYSSWFPNDQNWRIIENGQPSPPLSSRSPSTYQDLHDNPNNPAYRLHSDLTCNTGYFIPYTNDNVSTLSHLNRTLSEDYTLSSSDSSTSTITMRTSTMSSKRKRKRILNGVQRQEATQREKRRMLKLNKAFEDLRKVLPVSEFARNKLSRAETLKSAIDYINLMTDMLQTNSIGGDCL
ncbi:unnamed protein product [Didymodactylos carnosus]|uniref:BHLH domain-containing protein n=1 Tax=Didymodactylos carnosus TaxID=1234261 RepID=A0A814CWJ4_9BILA|nr:unnamed protein product [Didymodactylos carnosus]CAF0945620.1 unnamed protein product [Didymodactylos carnosus]CAF3577898.1 unnamed protein product [Didymodactylos carnosus]CAF3721790.1 unnamed protein product [Didymodactylos carnosus]